MTDPDPDLPDTRTTNRFDVFLCFTRADPEDTARADETATALRAAGLRVFRGTDADGIACSRVVLVYYSHAFPDSHSCRRELTAAFLAARRHGPPADRILVIDPESGRGHIALPELAASNFFPGPITPRTMPDLVGRVRRKVAEAGRPLGTGNQPSGRFAGRYRELWALHQGLHTDSRRAVTVRGLPGMGKTALAEQYAHLFRDDFGGGVLRLGPFGHHSPEEVLSQFHLALARVADVSGLDPDRLRAHVADRIDAAGEKVLVLVDDVPPGLPPKVLDRLLLPSPKVSTLITGRAGRSTWDVAAVDLAGLPGEEGLELFRAYRGPVEDVGQEAAPRLVERCGGHPITVRANALTGPAEDRAYPDTAPEAIRELFTRLGPLTRMLVRLGSLLAPVPFPPGFAREVLGLDSEREITEAVDEPVARCVVSRVDGGLRLEPLVADVARAELGPDGLHERAAAALPRYLADEHAEGRDLLLQHARTLAEHASAAHRISLLRPIAVAHEKQRDPLAAGEIHAMILATEGATSPDFTNAARVEIACGFPEEAAAHARHAVLLASTEDERYAARLVAAQALDCGGDYEAGDRMFWRSFGDRSPARPAAVLAAAQAFRLRGLPREAIALLDTILPGPGDTPTDLSRSAMIEYARVLLLDDRAPRARTASAEVIAAFRAEGRARHHLCAEAELLHAEATVTLDLRGLRPYAAELRELEALYEKRHGAESPQTLTVKAMADRALLTLDRPDQALLMLAATEQTVVRVLGSENRLRCRIRHGMGLAHGQLGEFGRQADLVEDVLPAQIRLLGSRHPETLESRLDLGIALALSGRGEYRRATELVDGAAEDIVETLGTAAELSAKASAAQRVIRFPSPLVETSVHRTGHTEVRVPPAHSVGEPRFEPSKLDVDLS